MLLTLNLRSGFPSKGVAQAKRNPENFYKFLRRHHSAAAHAPTPLIFATETLQVQKLFLLRAGGETYLYTKESSDQLTGIHRTSTVQMKETLA